MVAWEINLIAVARGGRRCARLRRVVSAVGSSDGVGRAVCALTGAWRAEAAEPPTHSIADGTAEIASWERR